MADFADHGIRIHRERDSLTWLEFRDVLIGLLATDSRLARHIRSKRQREVDDER